MHRQRRTIARTRRGQPAGPALRSQAGFDIAAPTSTVSEAVAGRGHTAPLPATVRAG